MKRGQSCALLMMVLCVGMGMFVGCKDVFHPESSAEKCTVTFYLSNESVSYFEQITVKSHTSLGSQMPYPYKSGHTFDGWWTLPNGDGIPFTTTTLVTSDKTLYASWQFDPNVQYNITFDLDGGEIEGDSAAREVLVSNGASLGRQMPPDPHKNGRTFGSWWTERNGGGTLFTSTTPVTASITLYAKWLEKVLPAGLSLEESLAWIRENADEDAHYTITLNADETIDPQMLSCGGKTVGITLISDSTERTLGLNTTGSLFTVGSGVTLTLGNNVTLQGLSDNTVSLVQVNSGGALVMESGSKISGNKAIVGGAVSVNGGTFEMNGGEISGNSAPQVGGAVSVNGGTFTMNNGTISGNHANNGGAVYVYGGTFEINGGTISDNTATNGGAVYVDDGAAFEISGGTISDNTATNGGAVYVYDGGTFAISGGTISGNHADNGGAVYVYDGAAFEINGGTISDNTADNGGAVYVYDGGTFAMSDGTISGNQADNGGAVYVYDGGTFAMTDGTISGNNAGSNGGAVFVDDGGTFTKAAGGSIYGLNASSALKNTAGNDSHAVYIASGPKKRNNTAGVGVTLDSRETGGWETTGGLTIALTPTTDPTLSASAPDVFVDESVTFTAGSGYSSYKWYVNNKAVSGATTDTYTLAANSTASGAYEVLVIVQTGAGEKRSARCKFAIKGR